MLLLFRAKQNVAHPALVLYLDENIAGCLVPPLEPCPGQRFGFWRAFRLWVHKLCEPAFEQWGVPGIFFHPSPAWQWLLLKKSTCLFRLVTSHGNALTVTVDFFTRGCSEKLNCSRPSDVEESHFQGLGKTFPPLLHCQPFRGAKPRESLPVFPQQHVLYSVWSLWETQVKIAHIKQSLIRIISYDRVGLYPFPCICCYFPCWLLAQVPTWVKDTYFPAVHDYSLQGKTWIRNDPEVCKVEAA